VAREFLVRVNGESGNFSPKSTSTGEVDVLGSHERSGELRQQSGALGCQARRPAARRTVVLLDAGGDSASGSVPCWWRKTTKSAEDTKVEEIVCRGLFLQI
jgi:hypothetical protein